MDPASVKANKQLASELGGLGKPSTGSGTTVTKEINENARTKEQQPLQDTLNIRMIGPTGDLVFDEVVSRGTGEEREFTTDYKLGRL